MSEFQHEKSTSDTNCHKINGVPQRQCKYVEYLRTDLAEYKNAEKFVADPPHDQVCCGCVAILRKQLAAAKQTIKVLEFANKDFSKENERYKNALRNIKNLRFEYAIRKVVSSRIDKIADQALNPKEKPK